MNESTKKKPEGRLRGLFVLDEKYFQEIYGPEEVSRIGSLVDIYAPVQNSHQLTTNPELLRKADVIFSGWGIPCLDGGFVDYLDHLKVIFYGAGSVKYFASERLWEKGIRISSAAAANAVPVAEYTLGQILVNLKRSWHYAAKIRRERTFEPSVCNVPGGYGSTVGLISLGTIARILCRYLEPFDLDIIAFDPYIDASCAKTLHVTMTDLNRVFENSDIVSLHSPLTDETVGMITGEHFLRMKPGSTFINTARGKLIREEEMIEVLKARSDITAILDVTSPEPPARESELYDLPNVVLNPHLAGAMGRERRRLGCFVVEELTRYLQGIPLKGEVKREHLSLLA